MKTLFKTSLLFLLLGMGLQSASAMNVQALSYFRLGPTNDFQFFALASSFGPSVASIQFNWTLRKSGVVIDFGSAQSPTTLPFDFWISPITSCGDYEITVQLVGLDASGAVILSEIASDSRDFCVDQYYFKGQQVSCLPCPPSDLRLAPGETQSGIGFNVQSFDRTHLALETLNGIDAAQPAVLKVLDLQGKVILEQSLTLAAGNQEHKVRLSGLTAGLYIVQIETQSGVESKKISVR
ncbi:MAG: T9SS type A sorting domain-containing protein [Bacteroidota bacterium]